MASQKKDEIEKKEFFDIFDISKSKYNELIPKERIQITGVTINPGVSIGLGVTFGGINLFDPKVYKSPLAVKKKDDVLEIVGYYSQS